MAPPGDGVSHTVPIHESHTLPHTVFRVAGRDLTEYLLKNLTDRGCSFTVSAETEMARDFVEKMCYIDVEHDTELKSTDKETTCELTDRNIINVGATRSCCQKCCSSQVSQVKEPGEFLTFFPGEA